ncbi:MFS transporter [Treponema sp. OttesenSCG-928-L16]|nr:MFS transporter [Treponema sp. OttesenSCG-928-L16]
MSHSLSPYRLGKARELYNVFSFFNSFSYSLLAGNIITLYAMRLNASSTLIGLLNALAYSAHFFMPLGKVLAKRFRIIHIFAFGWISRCIVMIPILFAPFAANAGRQDIALGLTVFCVFLFHLTRGIGMVGSNPVLNELASGPDRGSYITQIQVINSAVGMFAGFALALLLGRNPPLFLYSIIMAVGIVAGIFGGLPLLKIPEPENTDTAGKTDFFAVVKEAFAKAPFCRFITIFLLISLVSATARAFIIVYSREVFLQSDGMVSLYTVFGGLGALMMGLLVKLLVDRIGAKPIYIICTIISFLSILPILFFPSTAVGAEITVILFLTFLHFIVSFGFVGAEGIAQNYFFALIPRESMLNLGILYNFIFGLAGAAGSFFAGILLDIFSGFGLSLFISYKVLYLILIIILGIALLLQKKLIPLGALPFRGALEVVFSFRDLRAITLLDKLGKTTDTRDEEALLEALHVTPSRLSLKGLLERAKSPRLAVRIESLRALEALDTLSEEAERSLMEDMVNHPYTTAYMSARILGNHGFFTAIPVLRELIESDDYMLAGECMIALARLGDSAFLPEIEHMIISTRNPRLKIMGVSALGIYGSPNSLSALLDLLKEENPPPYLWDEAVLAMSSILDIQNQFYPLLVQYLEDPSMGATLALDEAEAAYEVYAAANSRWGGMRKNKDRVISPSQAKALEAAVKAYAHDLKGTALSRWILELPSDTAHTVVQLVLSEAVLDDELTSHGRFRLLVSKWAAHQLRFWCRKKRA